ncbi:hypothetical protein [Clostridium beijerinckii]|uniref:hypothetical protein n=1 Tax=Clostridium beijerinckii TaxID=1520 RepID=UPI00156EBB63|nr:hypothetical protein [Clostridium beijerinckii]NRT69979.1 hypothetical protein [Clostridium beijerinckii]
MLIKAYLHAKILLAHYKQALSSAEKQDNKNKIQQAINSLNSACQQLSQYQD